MTQAIERAAPRASNLAQVTGFNDRLIQLVKATVCPGASPLELATFLYNAKRLGLDPMTRQIYFIKYSANSPAEIVVGINGFRAQAEASGVYAGSDEPEYEYEDVGQPKGAPSKATVTVWKMVGGQRVPFTASARWTEFYPGDGKQGEQYRKRPHNQLAIRAESHALRKGFPQQTERLEVQAAPTMWIEAAQSDLAARDDPETVARNAQRCSEIFKDEDEEVDKPAARAPAAQSRKTRAVDRVAEPSPGPPPSDDDERAQMIIEAAHAAAQERDEDLDRIEAERQRKQEGLL